VNDAGPPHDHAAGDELGEALQPTADTEETPTVGDHVRSKSTWLRLLYMLLFAAAWGLTRVVVGAVIVLQFLWLLFTGATNPRLTVFGQGLATYTYEILLYLTFNTDRRPWPFADWPHGPPR
jgi:hypothetical protein